MVETEQFDNTGVAAHRDRARAMLGEITQEVRRALREADIGVDVFFVVPTSGDAVCTFGSVIDPSEEEWATASETVCSVVRNAVGLTGVWCRELTCATTADQSGELTSQANSKPIPTSMPLAAGGETR